MTTPNSSSVDVTVIVVNYNTRHVLPRMMEALRAASAGISTQVLIVDNASRDGSADFIRASWPDVTLLANAENVGFGRANNQAVALARGRLVLLLNPDAYPAPDALKNAIETLDAHPRCAIVGGRILQTDSFDSAAAPSARHFPTPWNTFLGRTGLERLFPRVQMVDDASWDPSRTGECDWVVGAFLLVRKDVIDSLGFFDPRYFLYSEEVDLCRNVKRAGWKVFYCAGAIVAHAGGESAKSDGKLSGSGRQLSVLQLESELLYFRKHFGAAGFAYSVILGVLADAINAAKRMLGRGRSADASFGWTRQALPLLGRTQFGTAPTR